MIFTNHPDSSLPQSLRSEFIRRAVSSQPDTMLYVVPNRVARNAVEREVQGGSGGRAISKVNVTTLDELAAELLATACPYVRHLSDAESAMLIEESIRSLLQRSALTYFERPRASTDVEGFDAFPVPRGTFEIIVNTIRRLEQSGVTFHDLKEDVSRLETGGVSATEFRRARDLSLIYDDYQHRLGESFVDSHQRMTRLLNEYNTGRIITTDILLLHPGLHEIAFEGFDVLDVPETAFLRLLQRSSLDVTIVTQSDNNPELFAPIHSLESELRSSGYCETAPDEPAIESALGKILSRSLFAEESPGKKEQIPGVELRSASDPATEVRAIARSIKELYHADTTVCADLSQIVVATPNVELYTPLFREVFAQFGIPVFIADRYHLDRAPLMQAVFAVIELARFGPRSGILSRLLRSPYLTFNRSNASEIDPVALQGVIARYHLSGSFDQVLRLLRRTILDLEAREASTDREDHDIRRELRECQEAIGDIEILASVVKALSRDMRPSEFRSSLLRVLGSLKIQGGILRDSSSSLSASVLEIQGRAYRSLLSLLEQMEGLLAMREDAQKPKPLSFYHERLRAASIWTRYNPRPNPRAVQVLSLEQSVDQPAEYLFLAGLQEDALPRAYEPQVFLPESRQTGEAKQRMEERLAFFRAVTNFKKELSLSYSVRSSGGRTLGPSEFVRELQSVIDLECVPIAQESSAVYSYADLYHSYGERSAEQRVNLVRGARHSSPFGFYRKVLEEQAPHALGVDSIRALGKDSIYTGSLDKAKLTDAERETLDENAERVWSVSQLELYGKCGFQYFLRNVLKLDGLEEEADGLEASGKGTMLHEVLRRFMLESRTADRSVRDAPLEESVEAIHKIAREHIAKSQVDHPFWQLDVDSLIADRKEDGGILRRFIERELALQEVELRPQYFEVGFGLGPDAESDPLLILEEEITIDGLKLRGKIDRIDVGPNQFAIVDYKSGSSVSKLKDIKRGISLQLPLYLRVAEDVLRSHMPHLIGVAGIYQKLSDPKSKRELGIAVKQFAEDLYPDVKAQKMCQSVEELADLINKVVERAKQYVDGMTQGLFPLTDSDLTDRVCSYCEYSSVCRLSEVKSRGLLRQGIPLETEFSDERGVHES